MLVVAYARVSTEEQSRDGVSLDAQAEKLRLYCRLHNLALVELIVDAGESAKSLDRPGVARALAMLDSGDAAGIVVVKLDRLTRCIRDWNNLIDRYFGEKAGKTLMSVGDSIDTRTAGGRLVLNVLMCVAQWEREAIAERTRDALRHKKSKGERVGRTPFGWDLDGDGKTLVRNPGEQHAISRVRDWSAAGRSLRWIAKELDRLGVPPKHGRAGRWTHTSVVAVLARLDKPAA